MKKKYRNNAWSLEYELESGKDFMEGAHIVITDANNVRGHLVIPAEIGGHPVTHIGDLAFHGCSDMTNVTIPDSVTCIGTRAFEGCIHLANVTIPDSVTSIGIGVFDECLKLTHVVLPERFAGKFTRYDFTGCSSALEIVYCTFQKPPVVRLWADERRNSPCWDLGLCKCFD